MSYRPGDNWLIDDITGLKILASESRRQWNGSITHKDSWSPRHPQEFVRSTKDRQSVRNSRPRGADTFVGPITTEINADHVASEITITVLSSSGFAVNDSVRIMLDGGDVHVAVVDMVPDSTTLVVIPALPGPTSAGKAVVNNTNVTAANL